MSKDLNELLDEVDARRFDVDAILVALAAYRELSDEEKDDAVGEWEYAGLGEAQHVLSGLIPEAHNATVVVRDLTGELLILTSEGVDGRWQSGPLTRDHFHRDADLAEELAFADGDLAECSSDLIVRVIGALPAADGPVRSY